ncbi:MAG TPA: hypothetical protein VFT58_02915 [Nitrososphaera sp.]|nr:hypothetical protein [Nitrososphaera sp.]
MTSPLGNEYEQFELSTPDTDALNRAAEAGQTAFREHFGRSSDIRPLRAVDANTEEPPPLEEQIRQSAGGPRLSDDEVDALAAIFRRLGRARVVGADDNVSNMFDFGMLHEDDSVDTPGSMVLSYRKLRQVVQTLRMVDRMVRTEMFIRRHYLTISVGALLAAGMTFRQLRK